MKQNFKKAFLFGIHFSKITECITVDVPFLLFRFHFYAFLPSYLQFARCYRLLKKNALDIPRDLDSPRDAL